MQYETCRHIKEDGTYCGSPALQNRKYCYYHLTCRGRRLRRARALRDNVPYRLDLPPLEDLASVQVALSEIVQALGAGQLDHRAAGKMLYAIQQTASVIKCRAKLEAAQFQTAQRPAEELSFTSVSYQGAASAAPQAVENTLGFSPCDSFPTGEQSFSPGGPQLPSVGNCGDPWNAQTGDPARVHDYPAFEQEFGLDPGSDLDAETDWTLRKADQEAELHHANDLPTPPPGLRPGSAQYRIYREEVYQGLNIQINRMRHELREYYEMKRKESEKLVKEAVSETTPPERLANSA